MWEKIFAFGKQVLELQAPVTANRREIEEIREDLKSLTAAVQSLERTVDRSHNSNVHEHETLLLRLQNALLTVENRSLLSKEDQDSA